MTDFQRAKVYAWDKKFWPYLPARHMLTESSAQTLVDKWWDQYLGLPRPDSTGLSMASPTVVLRRGITHGFYSQLGGWGGRKKPHTIHLPDWAMFPEYLIHEVAHPLADNSIHGAEFVRVLIDLHGVAFGSDWRELERSAVKAGLKVAEVNA